MSTPKIIYIAHIRMGKNWIMKKTHRIPSICRRQVDSKACINRLYRSLLSGPGATGRLSKAFRAGNVGPTKSISEVSSFSKSGN